MIYQKEIHYLGHIIYGERILIDTENVNSIMDWSMPRNSNEVRSFMGLALNSIEEDPRSIKEVIDWTDGELWKKAMKEEMESLKKNEIWDLVMFLNRRKPSTVSVRSRKNELSRSS